MTTRALAELVEEAAERLTSDQLYAIAARVSAHELRAPEPEPVVDLATMAHVDLDAAVRRQIAIWGPSGVGIDIDLLASWLLPQLIDAGVPRAAAEAALERRMSWRPRTPLARQRSVAEAMLRDGFSPAMIAAAIAKTRERVAC